ncbi:uncharacterized protein EDB91DRAFT_1247077 [Suillus paluster]|uniref:uncharacterized protein n=1 Tax=Suillus paluster TaxID=48578 RepID=UPI001B8708BA|nr:uncharacterized protein EDB91DRAFT_1247077 [Suillus paluster]KAG1743577.1 hypothetical protein EDB91DRAFT_1247077 [Suillus paluster]
MSSDWTRSFRAILLSYKTDFLAVKDSKSKWSHVIKKIRKAIVAAHKKQGEKVPLPSSLKKAIKRYYAHKIDDEESNGEGAAREREINACPKEASFYKKKLTDWDSKQEKVKQDPIKFRTGHAREWFNDMSPAQKKEVKYAQEKWNKEGAPQESQAVYCKNNLKKVLGDFSDHKKQADKSLSVTIHETVPQNAKKDFSVSSDGIKEWASTGIDFFAEWARTEFYPMADPDVEEKDEEDGRWLPEVIFDDKGYAQLPSCDGVILKDQQELVQMIFHASYKVFTRSSKPVPWRTITPCPSEYLEAGSVPDNLVFCNPSHMREKDINMLWSYWETRSKARKRLVTFIKARPSDVRIKLAQDARDKASSKKDKAYVKVAEDEDELHSSANLDATLAAASPAEVPRDHHFKFLDALSTDRSYLELVDAVKDLAVMMQNLMRNLNYPPGWIGLGQSLIFPSNMLMASMQMLIKTPIMSSYLAALVVLGLGLILRDCKRIIEYEEDEAPPDTPSYLAGSFLDLQCLIEVVMKAISGDDDHGDQEKDMEGADGEEKDNDQGEDSGGDDKERDGEEKEKSGMRQVGNKEQDKGDMNVQMQEVEKDPEQDQEEGKQKGKKRMRSPTSSGKTKKARIEDEPPMHRSTRTRQPSKKNMRS